MPSYAWEVSLVATFVILLTFPCLTLTAMFLAPRGSTINLFPPPPVASPLNTLCLYSHFVPSPPHIPQASSTAGEPRILSQPRRTHLPWTHTSEGWS